jgi:ribosome silencing factor RsfS/YbeB/iojap
MVLSNALKEKYPVMKKTPSASLATAKTKVSERSTTKAKLAPTTAKATATRITKSVASEVKARKPATLKPAAVKSPKTAVAKRSAETPAKNKAATIKAKPKAKTVAKKSPVDIVLAIKNAVLAALEDMKAKDVLAIDVTGKTSLADHLIFASGTSSRHLKALADEVMKKLKELRQLPRLEGLNDAEWMLVDSGDVIVHLMLPRTRAFYAIEKMWGHEPPVALG